MVANALNTLLVHHVEGMWSHSLDRFGETVESMCYKIIIHLSSPEGIKINNVIFTKIDCFEEEEPEHSQLIDYLNDRGIPYVFRDFGMAAEPECFEGESDIRLIPSTKLTSHGGDEGNVLPIDDWQNELSEHQHVALCGAFDKECINDAEDVLNAVRGSNWSRLDGLIVGSGVEFESTLQIESTISEINALGEACSDGYEYYDDIPARLLTKYKREIMLQMRAPAGYLAIKYPSSVDDLIYPDHQQLEAIMDSLIDTCTWANTAGAARVRKHNESSLSL